MGLFITVRLDNTKCPSGCNKCVLICPVDICQMKSGKVFSDEMAEDECTLCDLCLEVCPIDNIEIQKHY
jgi:Na+-translocating ferredoxin:NAD+ oxidoreductase RNF subunit RnfB